MMPLAKIPATIPVRILLRINGRRIKLPLAPISFIVLIINRLE